MLIRTAIHPAVLVVSARSRATTATFAVSLLGRWTAADLRLHSVSRTCNSVAMLHWVRAALLGAAAWRALGLTAHRVPAADPWFADLPVNQWVRQSPRAEARAPDFYYEGSGAFDPESGQWIHHGGHDGIPQGFHTFTCDLRTGQWLQHFPPTSPPGVCCVDGANVFDVAHRRFVVFPGGSLGHGFQWSRGVRLKDSGVWAYDPDTHRWMNMRPPPYREPEKYSRETLGGLCSGGTYDPNHQQKNGTPQ